MDDVVFTYDKMRRNFGRPMEVLKEEARYPGGISHDEGRKVHYAPKNPKTITLGNIPEFSEHSVSFGLL